MTEVLLQLLVKTIFLISLFVIVVGGAVLIVKACLGY